MQNRLGVLDKSAVAEGDANERIGPRDVAASRSYVVSGGWRAESSA